MKELGKALYQTVVQFGLDPRMFVGSVLGIPAYLRDWRRYQALARGSDRAMKIAGYFPVMHERFKPSGEARGHYFHQDLWAARKVFQKNPGRHIDIGSSISGFVSHVLAFRDIEVIDVRPLDSHVAGLTFIQSDATQLAEFEDNSLESISTLHAAEHFGLGRYGDPVDPEAHLKFMRSLARVLKPGGRLYFALPCGQEKLYFNAHRVLSPRTVLDTFSDLTLVSFSCVKDDGNLYENCGIETVEDETYGCGLFEFSKAADFTART